VIRVKLLNIPFLPEARLRDGLFDLFAPFGIVLEGSIFIDHGWFDGTGYAIISRPSSVDELPELTHALTWNDESVVYATWFSIPLHCSYCHKANHIKFDCPVRKAIRCLSCFSVGHIRAHCPKQFAKAKPSGGPAHPSKKNV
ncbi:hypothetical protein BD560DRAFT_337820, partial [Blakeslea trispora]